jgi:hypothetical protein
MARAVNLPQLTLVVNLRAVTQYEDWMPQYLWWLPRHASDGKVYDRIPQALRRLNGLKDFLVYLQRVRREFPLDHSSHQCRYSLGWGYANDEMRYEKAVTGEDYNREARGR